MKKLFMSLVVMLFSMATASAQTVFATLAHEGNLSSFSGIDALKQAVEAAKDGDIITLSSGAFNGNVFLKKAITLRGEGMMPDEQGRQTVILGFIHIELRWGGNKTFSIEGISMKSQTLMVTDTVGTVNINKCCIGKYNMEAHKGKVAYNTSITNSIINDISSTVTSNTLNGQKLYAYNSYLGEGGLYAGIDGTNESRYDNCVIGGLGDFHYYNYGSYYNCIFLNGSVNHTIADHCVATFNLTGSNDSNNYKVADVKTLFSNYSTDDDWFDRDLTLTEEAKALYLGNDGTEVGLYGGTLPFSPFVDRPFIKKLSVAPKSTADGKLSVDIEVGDREQ